MSKRKRNGGSVLGSDAQRHIRQKDHGSASRNQRENNEDAGHTPPVGDETVPREWSKLEEIDSNESHGTSTRDVGRRAGPVRTIKRPVTRRKAATNTKVNPERGSAPSPDPAPSTQALSARPIQSGKSRRSKETATPSLKMQQVLIGGTLESSKLMPEHVHFDYPGKDWVDKARRPTEAIDCGPDSQGGWVCKKPHAWGQYIVSSTRSSCPGCGDTRKKGNRMTWDLKKKDKDNEGYVINIEKQDIFYTPQSEFADEPGSRLEGKHQNTSAARMRIFLKRMYPEASEEELRQYWSKPFKWTKDGILKARELMKIAIEDVQAGKWKDDLLRQRESSGKTSTNAQRSSNERPAFSRAQDRMSQETEDALDLSDTESILAEPVFEHEVLANAGDEPVNGAAGHDHHRLETGDKTGTSSIGREHSRPNRKNNRASFALVQPALQPVSRGRQEPASHNPTRSDDKFYILLFEVIKDIGSTDQEMIRQYIARVCALPAWDTMERVLEDQLFRLLVGYLSWEIHVEDHARLATPLSQRMVDEVSGLLDDFWPDYKELLHALGDTSAVHRRRLQRNPNAEI